MDLLSGKKGLVVGVANERSYAWHIAGALLEHGATCAFTHLPGEKHERRARRAITQLGVSDPWLKPLDAGYALEFSADEAVLEDVFRLIQLERQCCAFLQFELTLEPDHGPVWLSLTGPEGTKAFLENVLGLPVGS